MSSLILGIESSCDETGVALVRLPDGGAVPQLLSHALHSQIDMHRAYGGVVPELASRDHIRRVLPLTEHVLKEAAPRCRTWTWWPSPVARAWRALLVGAGVACALGAALDRPVLGVHHLEGHLLSPFLSEDPPEFPSSPCWSPAATPS
jgi:N6-L-threonylcarbamoyladenine synthase